MNSTLGVRGWGIGVSRDALAERVLATLAILLSLVAVAQAEKPTASPVPGKTVSQPVRDIFVPYDQLEILLAGPARRVLMSDAEYQELLAKAKRVAETRAPRSAMVVGADYQLTIDATRARIDGKLTIEVLNDGLHAIDLGLRDVGIELATLDDRSAPLAQPQGGGITLFIEGRGQHTLTLRMTTELETQAAQQLVKFTLPRPSGTRLRAVAPGNVELKSGADIISRNVDETAGVTRFELVPVNGSMSLVLSLNNKAQRQQRVVVARSLLVDEVTMAYERLHATMVMSVLHRGVDQFRFALPEGFEITDVETPQLSRWAVVKDTATKGKDRRILEVVLRQETTGQVEMTLSAVRASAPTASWRFPRIEPLDVAGAVAVIGLLAEDRLSVDSIESQGLVAIGTEDLARSLPASVFQAEPGAPRVRPVVAYFAPGETYDVKARFTRPPSRLLVSSSLLLVLEETGLTIRGGYALAPEAETLYDFNFTTPANWHVTGVHLADSTQLPFDRYGEADKPGRIHVRIPGGIKPGQTPTVYFQAVAVPKDWLADWSSTRVEFPVFAVEGAETDVGVIAVDAHDDMSARPETLDALTPIDDREKDKFGLAGVSSQLAYRYEAPGYKATLAMDRVVPRLTARSYAFFRIQPALLSARYELIYNVQNARTRRLSLLLPESTPGTLTIRGLDGVRIKEYNSDAVENGMRRWTALLAEGRQGTVRLAVEFQQTLSEKKLQAHALPLVRADGVAYQSGIVAVEGSPELDVLVAKHPRRVDVGELVDAAYKPGSRLLGVFGYVGDDAEVAVDVSRNQSYDLATAIIQRAQYVTHVSTQGLAQTWAQFAIRTKESFVEVELPASATLWAVELDGKPAKPQRDGTRLLLSFPAAGGAALHNLQVVYETPVGAVSSLGQIQVPALPLALRGTRSGPSVKVPIADVEWQLHLPTGYRVVRSAGTVEPQQRAEASQELALWKMRDTMVAAASTPFFPTLKHAREAAIVYDQSGSESELLQEAMQAHGERFEAYDSPNMAGFPASTNAPVPVVPRATRDALSVEENAASLSVSVGAEGSVSALAQPSVTVNSGETLRGEGAISGTIMVPDGGQLSAGGSIESLGPAGSLMGPGTWEGFKAKHHELTQLHGANSPQVREFEEQLRSQARPSPNVPTTPSITNIPPINTFNHATGSAGMPADMGGQTPTAPPSNPQSGDAYLNAGGAIPQSRPIAIAGTPFAVAAQPATPPAPTLHSSVNIRRNRLTGVASLRIPFEATGEQVTFTSLGVEPELSVTVADGRRVDALSWVLTLIVALLGLARTNRSAHSKARFIIVVCLVATLLPLVSGWIELTQLVNRSFYMACALVPYYLLVGAWRWLKARQMPDRRPLQAAVTATMLVAILALGAIVANAQEPAAPATPAPAPTEITVELAEPRPPVTIPEDAVIRLYKPTDKLGVPVAEQLLVPYDRYQELWSKAYADKPARKPPASFASTGAKFKGVLSGDGYLVIEGQVDFELFVDDMVEIPLPIAGGVLASALVDGQAARLKVVASQAPAPQAKRGKAAAKSQAAVANAPPDDDNRALVMLYATGKGRHRLDLSVRFKLEREGGWRVANGRLPPLPAASLELTVPDPQTEVHFSGIPDRREYETKAKNEKITTALAPDGLLSIEWRPQLAVSQVDQTLTVKSNALVSVQEDGVRLAWRTELECRHSQRESYRLTVPAGYLVEKVAGNNVRGWQVREAGETQRLDITLLSQAANCEMFTIQLSRRQGMSDKPTELDVPVVGVEGAALHSGEVTIRRSALLDLRTAEASGVTRIDLVKSAEQDLSADSADQSPLGMRSYQSYRFATTPFTIRLAVEPLVSHVTAEVRTILGVAERERRLDCQVVLTVADQPIHEIALVVPEDFKIEHVRTDGTFEWAVTKSNDRRLLTVYLAQGRTGRVALQVAGRLGNTGRIEALSLPALEVAGVESQSGDIVVLADPAFDIETTDLKGCERVLMDRVRAWLDEMQRAHARTVLHYREPGYSGRVKLTARQPVVRSHSVTNVRVTDRAIEETILLDFLIRDAGIREIVFQLPASMRDARFNIPMLRQKTIEPVVAGDPNSPLRVRIQLQDEIMGELKFLVENDRLRTSGSQQAPIPVIETGQTDNRYVAVQTLGRDEVVVEKSPGLELLNRQQQVVPSMANLLRSGSTQAYRVRTGEADPQLVYQARDRAAVVTAGAAIGLAETTLVVDASGAYRAVQVYHVNNQTEQYLELELPEGTVLWTAWVMKEPVKPAAVPGASTQRVRIPLVKTAAGDLDYEVKLTYGGKLESIGTLRNVSFPFISTRNINVELSQVRLYLPESYRWFNFGGTMRRVQEEGDLVAGTVSYLTKEMERLARNLEGEDEYAGYRAKANLKNLQSKSQNYTSSISGRGDFAGNENVQEQLRANGAIVQQTEERIQKKLAEKQAVIVDNRSRLNEDFTEQRLQIGKNVVNNLDFNSYNGTTVVNGGKLGMGVDAKPGSTAASNFDGGWMTRNGLAERDRQAGKDLDDRLQLGNGSNEVSKQFAQSLTVQQGTLDISKTGAGGLTINGGDLPEAANKPGQSAATGKKRQLDGKGQEDESRDDTATRYGRALEKSEKNKEGKRILDPIANNSSFISDLDGPTSESELTVTLNQHDKNARGGELASLDVQIPTRGVPFFFVKVRGDTEVTATSASTPVVGSLTQLAAVLGVLLVGWSVYRLGRSGRLTRLVVNPWIGSLLVLVGFLFLVSRVLWFPGLCLGCVGIVLIMMSTRKSRSSAMSA